MNPDQSVLESKRVDVSAEEPLLHQILRIAVYDEFHAYETYSHVIRVFGPLPPFINIVEAEQRHIQALSNLCSRHKVAMPFNDWFGKITIPDTFAACCEMGIEAELENIAMYEDLLQYSQFDDVTDVFYRLQAASYNNHLPAFRACAASAQASADAANNPRQENWFRIAEQMLGQDFKKWFSADAWQNLSGENRDVLLGALLGAGLIHLLDQSSNLKSNKE